MDKIFENVNHVLSIWNPIGVPEEIAGYEYAKYIPSILKYVDNKGQLIAFLEDILINRMELGYDPRNKEHFEDLLQICSDLIEATKSH